MEAARHCWGPPLRAARCIGPLGCRILRPEAQGLAGAQVDCDSGDTGAATCERKGPHINSMNG